MLVSAIEKKADISKSTTRARACAQRGKFSTNQRPAGTPKARGTYRLPDPLQIQKQAVPGDFGPATALH